ncbi:hypothetical protein [Paenibacillus humicola]|uniref:hypothetical protein n=1 Tax=Paenibacillus humicola TaxID=3110540 RepID=UPI00237BA5A9|nr:hypothetical protein [Paenibacillus humicola]
MINKLRFGLFLTIAAIVMAAFIMSIGVKDDKREIEKAVLTLNQPMAHLADIEVLERNKVIAFYEWGQGTASGEYFGIAVLAKNLFGGWHFRSGATSVTPDDYKLGWSFQDLKREFSDYTDMIYGKILDADIKSVLVTTKQGKQYSAKIMEYDYGERFWFLITDGVDLVDATIKGLSINGETIEQIPKYNL